MKVDSNQPCGCYCIHIAADLIYCKLYNFLFFFFILISINNTFVKRNFICMRTAQ